MYICGANKTPLAQNMLAVCNKRKLQHHKMAKLFSLLKIRLTAQF